MANVTPPAPVSAPARTALPYGLGSVLGWREGDRFQSGVTYVGITCDPAGGRGGPDCDPENVVGLPKNFDGQRSTGDATPFIVYGHDACAPGGGNNPAVAQEYANAHLLAREEARAEQALWTGDLGNTPNFAAANGFPAATDLGSHDDPLVTLAFVEQALAETYGSLGVIHMSRFMATLLGKHLEKRGGRLYTRALDTPVVAGAGYGLAETATSRRIVGTGALFGYRGGIFTSSNRPGDLLDRATNILYSVAEREYVIGFDACGLVAATYTPEVTP